MRVKHSFILLPTKRFNMSKIRFGIIVMSSIILVASYLIMLYTFFAAYLSPIKTVVVNINSLGEANIEMFFLLASIPCVIYYLGKLRWSSRKKEMWVKLDE